MMTTNFYALHTEVIWTLRQKERIQNVLTCKHLIEDAAQSPEITGDARALSSQYLWSTVEQRAWKKPDQKHYEVNLSVHK